MWTPPLTAILPSAATRALTPAFLADLRAASAVPTVYLDTAGRWTTAPVGAPHLLAAETFTKLHGGGAVSEGGEGWTTPGGVTYRLVSVLDAAGTRSGVALAVGPTDPPPV